jgi:hypothetical protein
VISAIISEGMNLVLLTARFLTTRQVDSPFTNLRIIAILQNFKVANERTDLIDAVSFDGIPCERQPYFKRLFVSCLNVRQIE